PQMNVVSECFPLTLSSSSPDQSPRPPQHATELFERFPPRQHLEVNATNHQTNKQKKKQPQLSKAKPVHMILLLLKNERLPSRQTARQRKLHSLGDTVVDHLRRNINCRFARNENDSAPVSCLHPWQVMATQADAAHEVGFDDRRPVLITDFLEGLWFVMAEVVN